MHKDYIISFEQYEGILNLFKQVALFINNEQSFHLQTKYFFISKENLSGHISSITFILDMLGFDMCSYRIYYINMTDYMPVYITFEDFLELIPKEFKQKFLYNLDLFV